MQEMLLHDPTLWLVFSFGIFIVLAFILGRKSVTGMLDEKIAKIQAQISSAEMLKTEAEALVANYKSNLANAQTEVANIVSAAQRQADDIRARAEAQLAETMSRRETMLQTRIEQMERGAIDDIRRYAAELAVSATTEIINQKMTAQKAQSLTDKSIGNISEILN